MVANAVKELQSAKQQIAATINGLEAEAKQIDQAIAALSGLGTISPPHPIKKSTLSAATVAKMRLAAKARWVKRKAAQGQPATPAATPAVVAKPAKKKFTMSPAHREALIKAQKARWAKHNVTKAVQAPVVVANAKKKGPSPAGIARIKAAQKLRWAKVKAQNAGTAPVPTQKRTLSAAARKKLSEFQKKLWAERKAKAAKK